MCLIPKSDCYRFMTEDTAKAWVPTSGRAVSEIIITLCPPTTNGYIQARTGALSQGFVRKESLSSEET